MSESSHTWAAANQARAALYRWFAELFARELTPQMLADWQQHYPALHQAFSGLGLAQESARLRAALVPLDTLPDDERALELAADFAQCFLLGDKAGAPPFASYYLDDARQLYGKASSDMRERLQASNLKLHADFRDPEDHLSIYLYLLSLYIADNASGDNLVVQRDFIEQALLPWLDPFCTRCQQVVTCCAFYPALAQLLQSFIHADLVLLGECSSEC